MITHKDVEKLFDCKPFEATEWVGEELRGIDLGDGRLNERTRKIGESFARFPTSRINQACKGWMASKAAYHYFGLDKVTPDKIIAPHIDRTVSRMKGHRTVLALQDTVFFSFNHKAAGLGPIGKHDDKGKGLIMHHVFAVTPKGLPLGTLSQEIWARNGVPDESKSEKTKRIQNMPVEAKESIKWIKCAQETDQLVPDEVKTVTVCDREADFYEFIGNSIACRRPFVVRAKNDWTIDEEESNLNFEKVSQALVCASTAGTYDVEVLGNSKRSTRTAVVTVKFTSFSLKEPTRSKKAKSAIDTRTSEITAISVVEISRPPQGEEPIHWVLFTNEPVHNFEDAKEKIDWYCFRWLIEIYHKVMKSSCLIEGSRLRKKEKLIRYIALKSIIAYRIMLLTYVSRINPDEPATSVLTEAEWRTLYCITHNKFSFPRKPPSIRQCIRWLSRLGGFLGRKADGEPGIITVTRGWQRLCDYVSAFRIYQECFSRAAHGSTI
jgi:hypothetical protein